MDKKEIVINEPCEISIPKTGMVVHFDGERCVIGFLHNTDLAVDGDLRIATRGNFEVVTEGDQVFSVAKDDGKILLGTAEVNYKTLKELEDGTKTGTES